MIGAAIAAGFLVSRLMAGDRASGNGHLQRSSYPAGTATTVGASSGMMGPIVSRLEETKQAVVEGLMDQVEGELVRLREALIVAGQTFIRGIVTQTVDFLAEMLDPSRRSMQRPSSTRR
jgi:hypothetical protein